MKNFTKIIALALAIVLAFSLAACSNKGGDDSADDSGKEALAALESAFAGQWADIFIVSDVETTGDGEVFAQSAETPIPGVRVQVSEARGVKCPRCWKHSVTDHADGLCARCAAVVREQLGE